MTSSSLEASFAPYASPNSVMEVIRRLRETGLPDPLTLDGLGAVGVPNSMVSTTMRSLKFLGFVDDNGKQLPALHQLSIATSDDYQEVLGGIVKSAYSDVFRIVDPAKHDFEKVSDAFRPYSPQKQRLKMVRLFLGLCGEAGLAEEQPIRRRGQGTGRSSSPRKTGAAEDPTPSPTPSTSELPSTPPDSAKALINSFVAQLPDNKEWTSDYREKWINAVTSAVDLMITVSDSDQESI